MLEVEIREGQELRMLNEIVKRHPKPYIRERASAVLKVHQGLSAREVALSRLLQRRQPDTVRGWIHAYNEDGLSGLYHEPGRGRKPAFPP